MTGDTCSDTWEKKFIAAIRRRNATQTDNFADLFTYIHTLRTTSQQCHDTFNRSPIRQVEQRTQALIDQVRTLECQARTAESEALATRVCLKELQMDLQEKDELIRELSSLVNQNNQNSNNYSISSDNNEMMTTPRPSDVSPHATGSIGYAARVTAAAAALALKTLRRTPTAEARATPRRDSSHFSIGSNNFMRNNKPKIVAKPHSGAIMALDVINETDYITAGNDGYLAILDSNLLSVKYSFRASPRGTQLLFLCCYEDLIALVCDNCCVYIGDIKTRKMFMGLKGHQVKITGCAFITRTLLITCSLDQTIRVWSLDTACCLIVLHCDSPLSCLALARGCHYASSDNTPTSSTNFSHTVITGHRDGRLLIWKLSETGTKIRKVSSIQPLLIPPKASSDPSLHEAQITAVTFYEHNDIEQQKQLVISAGMDGRLLVSDPATGVQLSQFLLPGFLQPITVLATGQNNICCALGGRGEICVWNVKDHQHSVLDWPSQSCTCMLIDRKTGNLITGHKDGSIAAILLEYPIRRQSSPQ